MKQAPQPAVVWMLWEQSCYDQRTNSYGSVRRYALWQEDRDGGGHSEWRWQYKVRQGHVIRIGVRGSEAEATAAATEWILSSPTAL